MVSVSTIQAKGIVSIPNNVLKDLRLKEGDQILWNVDSTEKKACFERGRPQTFLEFNRAELQSRSRSRLLLSLKSGSKTFTELINILKVSRRTLAKELKKSQEQLLIDHEGRNKPYSLSERGVELLKISEYKPVEGNDLIIETVSEGPFIGSIILRLPSRLGKQLAQKLYTPKRIQDFNRIMLLGLQFWVTKHSQAPYVQFLGLGKDFNGDGIADLIICETPQGYPHMKELARKGTGKPLILLAYDALERELAEHDRYVYASTWYNELKASKGSQS